MYLWGLFTNMMKKLLIILLLSLGFNVFADSVPTLEKLVNEHYRWYSNGEVFSSCVSGIEYGTEGLLTQKKSIDLVRVGKRTAYLDTHYWTGLFEGDPGAPMIGDCFFFKVDYAFMGFSYDGHIGNYDEPFTGHANGVVSAVKSQYTIDSSIKKIEKKETLTASEYCRTNLAFARTEVTLTGIVKRLYETKGFSYEEALGIEFGKSGDCVEAYLSESYWSNSEEIKSKIRNIRIGDQLTVKGFFVVEGVPTMTPSSAMNLTSIVW